MANKRMELVQEETFPPNTEERTGFLVAPSVATHFDLEDEFSFPDEMIMYLDGILCSSAVADAGGDNVWMHRVADGVESRASSIVSANAVIRDTDFDFYMGRGSNILLHKYARADFTFATPLWTYNCGMAMTSVQDLLYDEDKDRILAVAKSNAGPFSNVFCVNASTGAEIWQAKTQPGATKTPAERIEMDVEGNYYVTSQVVAATYYGLTKFNTNGGIVWQYRWQRGGSAIYMYGLAVDDDNDLVYAGGRYATAWGLAGAGTANLICLNKSGVLQWDHFIECNTGDDTIIDILVDSDGNLIILQDYDSVGNVTLRKINPSDRSSIWTSDLGSSVASAGHDGRRLDFDYDGYIYVFNDRNNSWPGSGGANARLFKIDPSDGSIVWAVDMGPTIASNVDCCLAIQRGMPNPTS